MLPDRKTWADEFVNDQFYQNLNNYFESVIEIRKKRPTRAVFSSNYQVEFEVIDDGLDFDVTPREYSLFVQREIHLDTFYYIDYIRKNNTGKIYDIGCGSNTFKYFFKDIVGLDIANPQADIDVYFNDEYIQQNQNYFPNAIAINSLHFTSFLNFKKQIKDFASCIETGGYGYITFNVERLIAFSEPSEIPDNIEEYVKKEISELEIEVLSLDLFDVNPQGNNGLDGNIRVLFKA